VSVPKHIAIIMDGNGRWAQRRGHSRIYGHVRGSTRVKAIVDESIRIGVRALTLYAFSTENWSRPPTELGVLFKLLKKYLLKEVENLHKKNVRFRVIGEVDRLSPDVQAVIHSVVQKLENNSGLELTFALSYGSRRELARAASLFAKDCLTGRRQPEEMSEKLMAQYLWTSDLVDQGDVDLLIRTSGEIRVSNFLLWQLAYAEFFFTEVCWPEFSVEHFRQAIRHYAERERRFGALSSNRGSIGQAEANPVGMHT
jgi:undecaprenyl diphosphate synthase